jgi:hypothetical protein
LPSPSPPIAPGRGETVEENEPELEETKKKRQVEKNKWGKYIHC